MTQLALVSGRGHPVGRRERAAEKQLTRWRRAGHEVDELTSASLRAAAAALDRAERDHDDERASALSVSRCAFTLWQMYRDAAPDTAEVDLDELDDIPADLDADVDD